MSTLVSVSLASFRFLHSGASVVVVVAGIGLVCDVSHLMLSVTSRCITSRDFLDQFYLQMFSSANTTLRKALYKRNTDSSAKDDKDCTQKKGSIFTASRRHVASTSTDSEQPRSGQLKPRFRKNVGQECAPDCHRPLSISIDTHSTGELGASCDVPRRSCSASPHSFYKLSPISGHLSCRSWRKTSAPVVRLSPSVFVASRHEHPTVYDFEGWHSDSEG
ncbi:unnamed protein product, partial [Gongylonema pulchrum]|uniref:Transmembrane protein n=1 Tax=Gongylonema pulchrum TaxID=637853 RepID=A0A183ECL1_9BILA